MYKWPKFKEPQCKFPTEWFDIDRLPSVGDSILVHSESAGVIIGYVSMTSSNNWRNSRKCIRFSKCINSKIINDPIKWCYVPVI